ncbi:fumarate reductase flavo protein subunit [Lindgomyces ingoldianus]|uniref:Fumarate reductase flavo protein subunit n=1 Tax=Lindgomyces ingoldianus TaxID=673940 RepID=A0ACB6QWA1_9PLEO|nr:fumarate reductase flavo protein subunit [Lindgomyces ingoldianus]KAF2471294.1 fumarate reductase flavo protein subunit [Lindgomyces ingoldianus]
MVLSEEHCHVLVIGSGSAGFSAALSARQNGAKNVTLIDKCPEGWAGGNSYFTAGAFRTVHGGLNDLLPIVNNVDEDTSKIIDLKPYTNEDFSGDLQRVTAGRSDKELGKILVEESYETIKWLAEQGIRFQLSFNRQAYNVDGRFKFWGGLHLKTQDGGKGLIESYLSAAQRHGVCISFSTAAKQLLTDPMTGAVTGVLAEKEGKQKIIKSRAVILAAGGFEANPRMRSQYLGPGWDLALVRGTPFNTGDLLEIAMRDVGAKQAGNWSGCHSVAWDANAPPNSGDREISNEFTKSGYPLGLMVNTQGERFVDEGVDLRNYTYAKFGKAILQQPDGTVFQVWDAKMTPLLRSEEYRDEVVKKITANSIRELAAKCTEAGLLSPGKFIETIEKYNEAVRQHRKEYPDMKWDPSIKDGLSTQTKKIELALPKSNWALPLDKAPFLAIKVACGITFTFGGLAVHPQTTGVISGMTNREIPGLFCVGEMMGGLFYGNYPGGSGLTSGAVFGRRAGRAAAHLGLRSSHANHESARSKL